MEATAYTLAEGNGDGVTSIGIVPYHGIIAVDPSEIPYGTKVYIPGYGFAMAGDCGGAINGNRIDLFMESYNDAIQWGRRTVDMYILE
jgi:3D (Asp-Asp-Asp) domain-containing protein